MVSSLWSPVSSRSVYSLGSREPTEGLILFRAVTRQQAYLVCAAVMALMVLCFAEAGSRVSASGGPYAYVEAALGPLAGFLTGALNVVSALGAAAAVASLLAASAATLVAGPSAHTFMLAGATVSMFGFLCGTVIAGPRPSIPPHSSRGHRGLRRDRAGVGPVRILRAPARADQRQRAPGLPRCRRCRMATARRDVSTHGAPFVTPGGPLVPAVACASIVGVLVATATRIEVGAVAGAVALAIVVFLIRERPWGI